MPQLTSRPTPRPLAAVGDCRVAGCTAPATHTPVLSISLHGSEHVSRVELPTLVCAEHREAFSEGFLTAARRSEIEASLRTHGRGAPDWARTHVYFVGR